MLIYVKCAIIKIVNTKFYHATGGKIMAQTLEEKNNERISETRRFYLQQKSVRAECGYGSKNCSTCQKKDCKIRQFVEN